MNPFSSETPNATQASLLIERDPERAKALAREAGYWDAEQAWSALASNIAAKEERERVEWRARLHGMSARLYNALGGTDERVRETITRLTCSEARKLRNVGAKCLSELFTWLRGHTIALSCGCPKTCSRCPRCCYAGPMVTTARDW